MKNSNKMSLFLIALFTLSACGGSQADDLELVPLVEDEIELVPLVEETPTKLPKNWEVIGEIAYTDEFGTSNYSLTGAFSVDGNGIISGHGDGLITHSGPCFVLTDPYTFTIQGYYKPEDDVFVFEEFFGEDTSENEENSDLDIEVDNTFVSCTVGEGAGELFALLRPLILLAQADHGALADGQVPIPANDGAIYVIEFPGGSFSLILMKK